MTSAKPSLPPEKTDATAVVQWTIGDLSETAQLAAALAGALRGGNIVCLQGHVGAGKTTFVQALAQALGIKEDVTSPTFALMQSYQLVGAPFQTLWHADFYRLESPRELANLGFDDLLDARSVAFVEWPEMWQTSRPHVLVEWTLNPDDTRTVTASAVGIGTGAGLLLQTWRDVYLTATKLHRATKKAEL